MRLTASLLFSDNRQRRHRSARLKLEVLEDRLQPGSLLFGPQWSWFGSGLVEPDAFAAQSENEPVPITPFKPSVPADSTEPSQDMPVTIVTGPARTDSQEARIERPAPADIAPRSPLPLTPILLGSSMPSRQAAVIPGSAQPNAHILAPMAAAPPVSVPPTHGAAAAVGPVMLSSQSLHSMPSFMVVPQNVALLPLQFATISHSAQNPSSHAGGHASLNWSTFVTETSTTATGRAVAVDALGNSYVTGSTDEGTNESAFIAKYDSNGNQLYFTKFQAVDPDGFTFMNSEGHGIAVDQGTNAYVVGKALNVETGNTYAVAIKFDRSGNIFPGYGGGIGHSLSDTENDSAEAVAVDQNGQATLTGTFQINGGQTDIFALKYNAAGSRELWGNYYHFPGYSGSAGRAITVDQTGAAAYIAGSILPTGAQNNQIFVWKFDNMKGPGGNPGTIYALTSSDSADDTLTGIAVDGNGNPFVVGTINNQGTTNGYWAEINSDGTDLANAEILDGTFTTTAIALDGADNSYLTGSAPSSAGDTTGHALVAKLDVTGMPVDATVLAGDKAETGAGIAYFNGTVSLIGTTTSDNVSTDATTLVGTQDALLANIGSFM